MRFKGFKKTADLTNLDPKPAHEHLAELILKIDRYARSKRLHHLTLCVAGGSQDGITGIELKFPKKYGFNLFIHTSHNHPGNWDIHTSGREERCGVEMLRFWYRKANEHGLKLTYEHYVKEKPLFEDDPDSPVYSELTSSEQWIDYPRPVPLQDTDEVIEAIDRFETMFNNPACAGWGIW